MLQTLLWMFVDRASTRRVVKAFDSGWTVLALPVIWVAADTLLAHLTPDGNWGSLAYTQADVLPVAQLAAVFGVGGMLFVLMLVNSALALACIAACACRGAMPAYRRPWRALVVLTVGLRLLAPADPGRPASPIEFRHRLDRRFHRGPDKRQVARGLGAVRRAGDGARGRRREDRAAAGEDRCAVDARTPKRARRTCRSWPRANHVWLVAGLGVDDGKERRNEAWWFAPDGQLATNYLKHFMAPPEREFVVGQRISR